MNQSTLERTLFENLIGSYFCYSLQIWYHPEPLTNADNACN